MHNTKYCRECGVHSDTWFNMQYFRGSSQHHGKQAKEQPGPDNQNKPRRNLGIFRPETGGGETLQSLDQTDGSTRILLSGWGWGQTMGGGMIWCRSGNGSNSGVVLTSNYSVGCYSQPLTWVRYLRSSMPTTTSSTYVVVLLLHVLLRSNSPIVKSRGELTVQIMVIIGQMLKRSVWSTKPSTLYFGIDLPWVHFRIFILSGTEYYYRCTLPYTLGLIHADQSRWSPSKKVEVCKRAGIPEADGPFTTPATCYPIYWLRLCRKTCL